MTKTIFGVILLAATCLVWQPVLAQDQLRRQPVTLPADAKAIFLAQMLGHMVALDAVITALGRGDYAAAAEVAANEIAVPRFQDAGGGSDSGPGLGVGEHLPEAFRAIGKRFRSAAGDFAETARAMPAAPSGAQQQAVIAALGEITNECRACHDAYRFE